MNLSLKHKLMLQSLSPLAFLTIVRNFKFTPISKLGENQSYWGEFVHLNNVLIVVLFVMCYMDFGSSHIFYFFYGI